MVTNPWSQKNNIWNIVHCLNWHSTCWPFYTEWWPWSAGCPLLATSVLLYSRLIIMIIAYSALLMSFLQMDDAAVSSFHASVECDRRNTFTSVTVEIWFSASRTFFKDLVASADTCTSFMIFLDLLILMLNIMRLVVPLGTISLENISCTRWSAIDASCSVLWSLPFIFVQINFDNTAKLDRN